MKTFKRYKVNRKIYNPETSKYITYDDIHKLLLDHTLFVVLDDDGLDITKYVIKKASIQLIERMNTSLDNHTQLYYKLHNISTYSNTILSSLI